MSDERETGLFDLPSYKPARRIAKVAGPANCSSGQVKRGS